MSFLRTKRINGREYVYEVENYRDADGKTRQRVIRYLGPTNPRYGTNGAVDLHEAKEELKGRSRLRKPVSDAADDGGA